MNIDVSVEAGAWPPQDVLAQTVRSAVQAAAATARMAGGAALPATGSEGEISVVFTDDAAIRALNGRWRSQDSATNVLSFAQGGPGREAGMLGDIVLAQETVAREAVLAGKQLDHHIAHMVIHGFLHLLGYDHQNDTDAQTMEDLERNALKAIGIAGPYDRSGTKDD